MRERAQISTSEVVRGMPEPFAGHWVLLCVEKWLELDLVEGKEVYSNSDAVEWSDICSVSVYRKLLPI